MNFDVLIIGGGVAGWNDGRTTMIHDSEPK